MDHAQVLKMIEQQGYLTKEGLLLRFPESSAELLDTALVFLVSRNRIRKVKIAKNGQTETLYYVPG